MNDGNIALQRKRKNKERRLSTFIIGYLINTNKVMYAAKNHMNWA
jgi:hypothetical protein